MCGRGAPRYETGRGSRPPGAAPRAYQIERRRPCRVAGWTSSTVALPPRPGRSPRPPRPQRRRATCPGGRSSRAAWPRASRPAWRPAVMLAQTQVAQAQAAGDTPIGPKWWPSRWGPQDEAGASNWITPAKVLEAARLIKTGKIYELGRVYEAEMPLFGARVFALRIPGTPTGGPFGKNKLVYHDEFVCDGDRPGRHPVRWTRPHRLHHRQGRRHDRDAVLQWLHRGRDGQRLRAPEARHREDASRSSPAESWSMWRGSRGACSTWVRRSGRRRPGRAPAPGHRRVEHPAGRRGVLQYRVEQSLDEGQRQVQRGRARDRAGRRALVRGQAARPGRRGHLGDRGRAQPESGPRVRRAQRAAHEERDLQPREPGLHRPDQGQGLRVRLRVRPAPHQGRERARPGRPIAIV